MQPYTPETLPLEDLSFSNDIIKHLGPANRAIAEFNGILQGVINPSILLSPLYNTEAVLSSKIEGTQATVDEVLRFDAGIQSTDEIKNHDIQEIVNYRKTLLCASEELAHRPITLGFIKQMHKMLMDSVRGSNKTPGEFRKEQNWIGFYGSTIESATFVPPSPFHLMEHLENWEKYLAYDDIDVLVQTAIVHAQFEMAHPFKDGNGRIGRLLIPLFLYQKKVLTFPAFYLSEYLESHRDIYYEKLGNISSKKQWKEWIVFFLQAVIEQAKQNTLRVKRTLQLYDEMKSTITSCTRSQHSIQVLDAMFKKPIFGSADFSALAGLEPAYARQCIQKLLKEKVIYQIREKQGRKPAIYAFGRLLEVTGMMQSLT